VLAVLLPASMPGSRWSPSAELLDIGRVAHVLEVVAELLDVGHVAHVRLAVAVTRRARRAAGRRPRRSRARRRAVLRQARADVGRVAQEHDTRR
jgi:hypothetical protein